MQKTNRKTKKKNIAQEVNAKLQESDEKKTSWILSQLLTCFILKHANQCLKKSKILQKIYFLFLSQ